MAVVRYDPDRKKEEGEQTNTSQQVLGGESRGSLGGAPSTGTQPQQGGAGTKSGSFTNLKSYLDAAQGQDFGKEVAGNVKSAQQAGGIGMQKEREKYVSDVDKGAIKWGEPDQKDGVGSFVTGAIDKPGELSDEDIAQFKTYSSGTGYGGPGEYMYDPASDTARASEKGLKYGDLSMNPEGSGTMLRDMYARPEGYTRGQSALDAMLMGGGNRESFAGVSAENQRQRDLQNEFTRFDPEGLEGDMGGAQGAWYGAQQSTKEAAEKTRAALGGAVDTMGENLESTYSDAVAKNKEFNAIREAIAAGDITPEQAQAIGFEDFDMFEGSEGGYNTYGLDITDPEYFNVGSGIPNRAQTMTPEQYARAQALGKLGGDVGGYMPGDPSQVGTYKAGGFDIKKYKDRVLGKKHDYEKELKKGLAGLSVEADLGTARSAEEQRARGDRYNQQKSALEEYLRDKYNLSTKLR